MSDDQVSTNLETILSGEAPQEPIEPVVEEAAQVETPEEPPAEPEVEAPVEPAAAEPAPQTVPLAVMMEERKRRQELEAQIAELNAPKQDALPDVFENPEGFTAQIEARLNQHAENQKAVLSERFARNKHGNEVVDAAFQAAQASGVLDSFRGKDDAWGDLVSWHRSQVALNEIGGDIDAYKAKIRAEIEAELNANQAVEQAKQMAAKAAPSMANVTGTGGTAQAPVWNGPKSLDSILGG